MSLQRNTEIEEHSEDKLNQSERHESFAHVSEDNRRTLRGEYTKLLQETIGAHKDIVSRSDSGHRILNDFLKRGNYLHQRIVHTREGALDASWFTTTSKFGSESVLKIAAKHVWDVDEFCRKLKRRFALGAPQDADEEVGGEDQNTSLQESNQLNQASSNQVSISAEAWKSFGGFCAQFFRKPPSLTFMHGPLELDVTKRKKPVRRAKALNTGESVQPEKVNLNLETKEDESTAHVAKLHKKLSRTFKHSRKHLQEDKITFWGIVLDPTSFTKTIENIFYYSFLLKDARAGIRLDSNDKELYAAPLEQRDAEGVDKKQFVLNLDYNTYLQLCEKYSDKVISTSREARHATQSSSQIESQNTTQSRHKRKRDESSHSISKRSRTE